MNYQTTNQPTNQPTNKAIYSRKGKFISTICERTTNQPTNQLEPTSQPAKLFTVVKAKLFTIVKGFAIYSQFVA
jgi:hypothetical protein